MPLQLLENIDHLFAIDDRVYETVDVPEWRLSVRMQSLTSTEKDAFEDSLKKTDKTGKSTPSKANFRARLIALMMVDGQGNRLAVTPEQIQKLGEKNSAPMDRLLLAALKLSNFDTADVDAITKNSEPAPAGDAC